MKLKDFETCVGQMGFELISVGLSGKHGSEVQKALAVEKVSPKKCYAYVWWYGGCRKIARKVSYADVKANASRYCAKGPCGWLPFPELNMSKLEQKYFEQSKKAL